MKEHKRSLPTFVSVIIPVTENPDSAADIHDAYRAALNETSADYEMIYVLDGEFPDFRDQLDQLKEKGEEFTIIQLGKHFGESAALQAGVESSKGEWILTLPAYFQFDAQNLSDFFQNTATCDLAIGSRARRTDSKFNQLLTAAFNALVSWMTATDFHDLGNGGRFFHRSLLDEIPLYGDQHRFLPVIAARRGYRVQEVRVSQSSRQQHRRLPKIGVYPRRLIDILTVFFLVKFTKKPLRFFGLIGMLLSSIGALWMAVPISQRIFLDQPLADRPALFLSSLLIVLGVQLFALGLIGEIIIFAHAREIKEYTIEEIVN